MSVSIKNVTKMYGDARALDNVAVEIADGEFIAILGPSGCGKTTLLRTISGFVRPTGGTVEVDGRLFSSDKVQVPVEQRGLGMVFQSFALARAIVEKPALLLMDEPLSALDAELKISMRKEIQDIHKLTGASIVYVTHDQTEAMAMADRIIIMKEGRIEQVGTPEEIYYRPKTLFAATFVSKCNLVRGRWEGDCFWADAAAGQNQPFARGPVESCFREAGVCPVRPEEFTMTRIGMGLEGRVVNRQWGGREIHYKVECGTELFTVYAGLFDNYAEGDRVVLQRREAAREIAI